ncbi:MAG TPA: flavin reductase family protein [Nocardioidaceae bacterium]|nr:flavin reductase family protein [Nocardioidaceae bacterium]
MADPVLAQDSSGHVNWPSQELIESFLDQFDFEDGIPPSVEDGTDPDSQRHFRDVLGRFASGVTVVTSISNGQPVGMTAQSFTSVSLHPPLVLFCPAKTSQAWPAMQRAGFFCVNLLSEGQDEISNKFARRGEEKFAGIPWTPASTGAPLLDGVLGWVDCTVHAVHEAGDHYVVLGQVQDLGVSDAPHPLLFYRGQYHRTNQG